MNEQQPVEFQKHKAGRRKIAGVVAMLLVVAIGGFIWLAMRTREPYYHGKPLGYWLSCYGPYGGAMADPKDPKIIEAKDAIQHIGTNAIPSLLRMLRAKDSAFTIEVMDLIARQDLVKVPFTSAEEQKGKAQLGFHLLGDLASNAFPALIDISTHPSSDYSKQIANSTLMQLFPAPCAATPYWVPREEWARWYIDAGRMKLQSEAASNAILAFSEAIKLDPTNEEAFLIRGEIKVQFQDFTGAMLDLGKVLELSTNNEDALYHRGLCKYGLKDFKSAGADFTLTINLETNDARGYIARGLSRANLRELDGALADFNTAIGLSPREASNFRFRAVVETMQKEYELALEDASRTIELDQHEALGYATRGRIHNALKNYQAALADYDKAIELNPKDSETYSSRGATRMCMGDFSSAVVDLEKALQLNPTNASAFLVFGILKAKRGAEDEAALADLKRAAELAPQAPEAHGMLGLFQYKISQWEPALANCRKALKLGAIAGVADFNSYIWLIRAQSGEEAAANDELNAYLKSLPGAKTNDWSAITARFLTGNLSESNLLSLATTAAKRPSAVRGQVCESFYYAAMKRKLAGDQPGALGLFQKCLDTKDDDTFAFLNAVVEMRALKQP